MHDVSSFFSGWMWLVQVVWRGYVQSMLQASFTSDLVLYAASGLLTYGANDGMCCASFSCPVTGRPKFFHLLLSAAWSCMLLLSNSRGISRPL